MSIGLPQSAYRPLLLQFKDCSVLQIPPSSENSREGLRFPGVSQSIEKKMENRYGCYYQGSALWRSLRDGDFEEADVWEVLNGKQDSNNSHLWASGERPRSSSSRKHPPSAPKTISRSGSGGGGGGGSSSTPSRQPGSCSSRPQSTFHTGQTCRGKVKESLFQFEEREGLGRGRWGRLERRRRGRGREGRERRGGGGR
ncbi:uncharacterized protein LOC104448225 [Eucalyptus grandis]|uniref:uncharacterized protein LOC104448225 n=1 Tax=Eucalyptus grandis TaxID=71139 RepID=UPI00192F0208|nr:uncharacterized protein LOC104448225 [Eucalyptus grandis]